MVTVQSPVSVQCSAPEPDQPLKMHPAVGAAERVTSVPKSKSDEQRMPQVMPTGSLVTVPVPVPVLWRIRE